MSTGTDNDVTGHFSGDSREAKHEQQQTEMSSLSAADATTGRVYPAYLEDKTARATIDLEKEDLFRFHEELRKMLDR